MHLKLPHITLFLLIFIGLSDNSLIAQDGDDIPLTKLEREQQARENITQLKEGVLVIRLASQNKKITELKRLIASQAVDDSDKERLQRQLSETIQERDAYNKELANAFAEHYDFSQIYYMYDTASTHLKNGQKSGYFLDKELNIAPSVDLGDKSFFVLRSGTTNAVNTSGIDALIIMGHNFKDLERPFPYYVRLRKLGHILLKIFKPKSVQRQKANDLAEKLNSNLWKFFNER